MIPGLPIQYNDAEHRYTNLQGQPYRSATQLLDLVKNKFDTKFHARRMAEEHGHTPGYWKRKWKKETEDSLVIGNNLHNTKEMIDLAAGIIHNPERKIVRVQNADRIGQFDVNYWYWPPGMYPELILWNHTARIAGRADRVYLGPLLYDGKQRVADIEDHKTNKRLAEKSFYDYKTGQYTMLKEPLSHLMDCELVHYTLQLSIYQWMLEQMGFAPGIRRILHYPKLLPDMGPPGARAKRARVREIPYLREEVETLISYGLTTPVH